MMKIHTIIIAFLVFTFLPNQTQGQEYDVKIKRSEFKVSESGFKNAWKEVKKGNEYFGLGEAFYLKARQHYLKANEYNSNNAALNFRIGICYLFTDNKFEAIKYMKKAYALDNDITDDIHFLLGKAHHLTMNFDTAIHEYSLFRKNLHPKEVVEYTPRIDKLIQECENGKKLVENPVRVIVKNPGEAINSEYDDYYAIPDKNDSVLFYTSRRPLDEKSKRSKYDNKYFENIHKTKRRDNDWDKGVVLDKPLNSRGNEAALDLSMDGRRLYIYNGDKNRGDFYKAEFKKGKWRKPKSLSSRFNSRYQETSLDASEGDSLIFFVSGNEKDSRGGKDIYYATLKINGRYNKPVNLGSVINTRYNEEGVFYDADNKTLYFSSKGHNTMGGYDVFKSKRDENGNWSEPVNLGYPANTPDDDLFFRISPVNPKYAYYTANREGTLGRRDIFQLIFLGEEKEMLMSLDDELIAYFNQPVPSIFFEKPEQIEIDTSLVLKGMIYDTISNEPVVAKLELIDIERSMTVATAVSNENGQYKIKIKQKKEYGVEIMARGYLFFLETIDLSRLPGEIVIERDFGLTKVEVGSKVILKNIFFETNKATLKPESYQELQNVVKFLDNNPSIHLEISGHTDNIGSLKANMKLSEERAKSVVEYLVAQKISRNRLEAKGYAFTQPVAPNNTPEGRAQNRRVEFKVISK